MKALVLDGSLDGSAQAIHETLTEALAGAGCETETVMLRDKTIAPCLGCFGCWVKTPGECVIDDDGRTVARAFARAHLVVYFTPVTFGGVSSELKKALDRMIPNISPLFARVAGETHHVRRYRRPPSLVGLGILPRHDTDAESVFCALVERNARNIRGPRMAAGVVALDQPREVPAVVRKLLEVVAR